MTERQPITTKHKIKLANLTMLVAATLSLGSCRLAIKNVKHIQELPNYDSANTEVSLNNRLKIIRQNSEYNHLINNNENGFMYWGLVFLGAEFYRSLKKEDQDIENQFGPRHYS